MVVAGRRRSIAFFIALGAGLISVIVLLYIGWVLLRWHTGILLFLSEALKCYDNQAFPWKMWLALAGILLYLLFQRRMTKGAQVGTAGEMRDPPAANHARESVVGIVVQHDHARAREVQLLDGAQPDIVQAADDHVTSPVAVGLRIRRRDGRIRRRSRDLRGHLP